MKHVCNRNFKSAGVRWAIGQEYTGDQVGYLQGLGFIDSVGGPVAIETPEAPKAEMKVPMVEGDAPIAPMSEDVKVKKPRKRKKADGVRDTEPSSG